MPVRCLLLAMVALSAACGRAGPRSAADVAAARCDDPAALAAIEVYPIGLVPQRRFRSLGAVEARWDVSTTGRARTLQTRACELGADAVIGWSETGIGGGLATGFVQGSTIVLSGGGGHMVASGIAIVYTDRQRAAAPPILARASDGGAPIVVDAAR